MNTTPLTRCLLPAVACLLLAGGALAQSPQAPITGQMLGDAAPAAQPLQPRPPATVDLAAPLPASPVVASPAVASNDTALIARHRPAPAAIGETTRALFRLQASGEQAGPRLPILGDQATLSYARYLKSFEHAIPDFFETDVAGSKGTSASGR